MFERDRKFLMGTPGHENEVGLDDFASRGGPHEALRVVVSGLTDGSRVIREGALLWLPETLRAVFVLMHEADESPGVRAVARETSEEMGLV